MTSKVSKLLIKIPSERQTQGYFDLENQLILLFFQNQKNSDPIRMHDILYHTFPLFLIP